MPQTADGPVLARKATPRPASLGVGMARARAQGRSAMSQIAQFLALARGPGRIEVGDYYGLGLHRLSLTDAERRAFLSDAVGTALNRQLSPDGLRTHSRLLDDKLLFGLLLDRIGLAVPQVLAVAATGPVLPGLVHIEGSAAIARFLAEAPLPLFGKPVHASRGIGVCSVFERSADGRLATMGDGRSVVIADLAQQIAALFPDGYILQRFVDQHPVTAAWNPRALTTLRLVTLMEADGPMPLYATLRVAGAAALTDGFARSGSAHCAVDPASGRVLRAQSGNHSDGGAVTHHPPTGLPLVGVQLPYFPAVVAAATLGHRLVPEHGIIGWDVAFGPVGPVIVEANHNPIHGTYQMSHDRGFLNPEFKRRIDAVVARNAGLIATRAPGHRRTGFLTRFADLRKTFGG